MKKIIYFFAIYFVFNGLVLPQNKNREFRSTWVITWEYCSTTGTVEDKKAKIRTILDNHVAANMTSVIWQVRQAGTAYYPSSYEPWGSYLGNSSPGFDPLAYAIDEAHKRGLDFHAWFNVFACASTFPGTPAQTHPEWVCRDNTGAPMTSNQALSPGIPEVRTYLNRVAMEVVRKYDIDGFHLDYIRWNEYSSTKKNESTNPYEGLVDGMFTEEQMLEVRSPDGQGLEENNVSRYLYDYQHPFSAGVPAGFSTWEEWWRWSVTEFVRTLQDSIKSVKPYVRLSVAALGKYNWTGWCGYSIVFQDAALWFNEGYIDQIAGMHYHWTTGSGFIGMLSGSCPSCWSQFIQPGIAAGRFYTVGPPSYILKDQNLWGNHPQIVSAIRSVPWTDGFQFFSYGTWRDMNYWQEAADIMFKEKMKQRAMKFILDTIPSAPITSIIKTDSLHYKITVTPPDTSINQWYVLYRSDDDVLNPDNDKILTVKFGKAAFTVNENFDGWQNFSGRYSYFATMCDRYWNESNLSNVVITDPISTIPPKVLSTIPSESDTVTVISQMKFEFSKGMNSSTFTSGMKINPSIQIGSASWSSDKKSVTFTFSQQLHPDTIYTVTLDSLVTDLLGVSIDGNGDGIAGDSFILQFFTENADNSGPMISQGYPNAGSDQFDPEDLVSIVFNECIDPSNINYTTVALTRNGNAMGRLVMHNVVNERSVLTIKPGTGLAGGDNCQLTIKKEIKDLYGNLMLQDYVVNFTVAYYQYSNRTMIDDFSVDQYWMHPGFSGSTTGILISGTLFAYTDTFYVPGTTPAKSAYLQYLWDPIKPVRLLREYLSGGTAQATTFDTSKTIQLYVFGDGSNSRFRFAVDEGNGTSWPIHEVSKWITIDWIGWRLVEWRLNDPTSVGSWIGNGILDNALYRTDSFQLTDTTGSAPNGLIYFDSYSFVTKQPSGTVDIRNEDETLPAGFYLAQNYPNPFNPSTEISYRLADDGQVSLRVYDILGNEIALLVNEYQRQGVYNVSFDASNVSSGIYVYELSSGEKRQSRKMILVR